MEAAVLERRIMADARAELQVQRLQELVRRLEKQNEQLRSSRCIPPDPFPYFQTHSAAEEEEDEEEEDGDDEEEPRALLDELTLLDLQSASPSGESDETWLYVSPRALLRSGARLDTGLDALQWTRHVLDQQRHSLGQKLEPVSRWRSGFSSPAFPRARVVGVSPLCTSSSSKPCAPLPSSTSCETAGQAVRRSMFSQPSLDSDVSVSEPDNDAVSLSYKLQDLTDVQVMARLQEESLRQDYASTSSSVSRRSSCFSFQFGQHGDPLLDEDEDEEEDDEEYGQLPPPQPRLSRAGPLQRSLPHSHTFSSIRDWTQTQTPCRDSLSLRSSSVENENKLRRSMPNLLVSSSLSPVSPGSSGSSGSVRNSQSFESSGALTRLQSCIPAPAQLQGRVQSVGNFSSRQTLKATAYVSPTVKGPAPITSSVSLQSLTVSGIPKVSRSGLPRPSSFIGPGPGPRGKPTAPVRSLLPPPKSLATLSALRDGSWRDGCY